MLLRCCNAALSSGELTFQARFLTLSFCCLFSAHISSNLIISFFREGMATDTVTFLRSAMSVLMEIWRTVWWRSCRMERLEEHLYPERKEMSENSEKTTKCSALARRYRWGINKTTNFSCSQNDLMFLEHMWWSVVSMDRLKWLQASLTIISLKNHLKSKLTL